MLAVDKKRTCTTRGCLDGTKGVFGIALDVFLAVGMSPDIGEPRVGRVFYPSAASINGASTRH
jgi:hypothetical protein